MGDVKAEDVDGLVSNFHWIVMRKRRQKKMTQKTKNLMKMKMKKRKNRWL